MPLTPIHQAVTYRLDIMDTSGATDDALVPAGFGGAEFLAAYRAMLRMRKFDEKALILQRQGRMGTYSSIRGQEAAQYGLGLAMGGDDWLVPAFREHGLLEMRGLPMHIVYAYWRGDERGCAIPEPLKMLPVAVPVGSQWLHAAGLGTALRLKGDAGVVVGTGGDGSTSEGDFHEALNFAAVFKARTLFYIQNNHWAISVPLSAQTATATLAQKGHAYNIPTIQVDGNDFLAVYRASKEAIDAIRGGAGPYLIEAHTYRLESHTTADDQSKYRDPKEVEAWRERDPLLRLRRRIVRDGLWSDAQEEAFTAELAAEVEREVAALEAMPPQDPREMFRHHYADMPWFLTEQMNELLTEVHP